MFCLWLKQNRAITFGFCNLIGQSVFCFTARDLQSLSVIYHPFLHPLFASLPHSSLHSALPSIFPSSLPSLPPFRPPSLSLRLLSILTRVKRSLCHFECQVSMWHTHAIYSAIGIVCCLATIAKVEWVQVIMGVGC